jgi:hypothetical protein
MADRIIIYASEIAKLTRCTEFARKDIANTIETIWKRNRPQTYKSSNARKIVRGVNQFISQNTVKVEAKNMTIEDMKEVNNSYKTMVSLKEDKERKEISETVSGIIQDKHLTEYEKKDLVEAIIDGSDLDIKYDNCTEPGVIDAINRSELKEKNHIMSYYDGMARKALGSAEEATVQTLYKKKTGKSIQENNSKTFSKRYKTANQHHFEIRGKIDGLVTDFDEKQRPFLKLIEIKNRTNNLFGGIPFYEKIQLEFYLNVLDLDNAELVERLRDDMNIIPYIRNEKLYRKTLKSLSRVVDYMIGLWSNMQKILEYQSLSVDDRNAYLNDNMPAYLCM